MGVDIEALRALCEGTTFPIATKRRAVDTPFTQDDLGDSCLWYYVCSDDGDKHAAFAAEEDAVFYAAARTALPAALDEIERLQLECSAHRALDMLQPKDMTYQQRSEFERLKQADVDQGRRVAELLADVEALRSQLAAALDAKGEACELALAYIPVPSRHGSHEIDKDRIHQLAAIGTRASGEE